MVQFSSIVHYPDFTILNATYLNPNPDISRWPKEYKVTAAFRDLGQVGKSWQLKQTGNEGFHKKYTTIYFGTKTSLIKIKLGIYGMCFPIDT